MINQLETKLKDTRFVRVDSDVVDKLILKEETRESKLSEEQKDDLKSVFNVKGKAKEMYNVVFETLDENEAPVIITQSEFMRRMKDMSAMGGGMNFYGELPDSYNLVVNPNHQIVNKISDDLQKEEGTRLTENNNQRKRIREEIAFMEQEHKKKKSEEVSQVEKDDLENLRKELTQVAQRGRAEHICEEECGSALMRQVYR